MLGVMLTGALLFAQTGAVMTAGTSEANDSVPVAYEELSGGQAAEAIRALEAMRAQNPGDPAVLINLGSAYAELGDAARAEEAYRSAIESDVRYRLELADGSWVDSRHAARLALRNLENARLAMN